MKIENGEFTQLTYSDTPCAKCHLNENSDLTMEYVQDMESRIQNPPSFAEASASDATADKTAGMVSRMGDDEAQTSDISHLPEEEVLPVSVMSEVVFRLLSLTPETRDVVCWRFAGISYRDIAILQGVTVAAVEKRHWKAMTKWPALRAMFAMKTAKHARRKQVSRSQNSESRMNAKNPKGRRMDCEKRNG
jgi:hypothetical protein